jgi:hypothetical protein
VATEDPRLVRLTEICRALPECEREYTGQHAIFRVRSRTFAYFLDDHHGDGVVALSGKAPAGVNEALAESEPERFYVPSYTGPRGWVALRLDRGEPDWEEVAAFVAESYLLVAPKRLAALVTGDG